MPRLDFKAIVIAYAAGFAADFIIGSMMMLYFARDLIRDNMTEAELEKISKVVYEHTAFLPWAMVCSTVTTIGAGWLAARIAGRIPYYHGLALGVVSILVALPFWNLAPDWFNYLGLLMSIPASLYGAHLARKRMTEQ